MDNLNGKNDDNKIHSIRDIAEISLKETLDELIGLGLIPSGSRIYNNRIKGTQNPGGFSVSITPPQIHR